MHNCELDEKMRAKKSESENCCSPTDIVARYSIVAQFTRSLPKTNLNLIILGADNKFSTQDL